MKWTDLDLEARTLRIRRRQVRGVVGPPKTKASRRILPLPDELVRVLREHRRGQLRHQVPGFEHGWVFPSKTGGLMQPSSARKPLETAAIEAGLAIRLDGEVCGKRPSPQWFRFTLNRLLRRVAEGMVQRSITGHVTEAMAEHYDNVALHEKRAALSSALHLVSIGRESVDAGVDGENV